MFKSASAFNVAPMYFKAMIPASVDYPSGSRGRPRSPVKELLGRRQQFELKTVLDNIYQFNVKHVGQLLQHFPPAYF
jgi:hypothetical protein